MATAKVRGITIEIGADTNPIINAFKTTQKSIGETEKSLKDVEKLLKLDPSNVTLLDQKQQYLNKAIAETSQSLKLQEEMLSQIPTDPTGALSEEYLALERNIEATKAKLEGYNGSLAETQNKLMGVEQETKDTGQAFDDTGKKASTFAQVLKANLTADALKGLGSALVNAGKQLWDMGKASAGYADDVMTLSTQFGIGTDALQEYMYMSELTDTSVETITGSITKLTKNMQSASTGGKGASEAFAKLGIDVTNADGSLRDSTEVFNEAIGALGNMESGTDRNALAMQIFGKSAMDLNPLIEVGADGLADYAKEAHNMGYVLDTDALEALGNVDDAMQRSNKALEAVKNQVGAALAPVIADITEKFAAWAMSVDWEKVGAVISKVANAIGVAFNWVVSVISVLIEKIKAWAETVDWEKVGNTIGTVFKGIATAVEGVIKVFKTIIEIAGKVVSAISDIFTGKFEFPKIKLPHFTVDPKGWKLADLLKGSIPKLKIEWWAKGMEGMVLDGPTIFGMNKNGQLMAGGEAGREIIIGENNLKRALAGAGTTSINIVVNEASSPRATAMEVSNEIQRQMNAYGRAWR